MGLDAALARYIGGGSRGSAGGRHAIEWAVEGGSEQDRAVAIPRAPETELRVTENLYRTAQEIHCLEAPSGEVANGATIRRPKGKRRPLRAVELLGAGSGKRPHPESRFSVRAEVHKGQMCAIRREGKVIRQERRVLWRGQRGAHQLNWLRRAEKRVRGERNRCEEANCGHDPGDEPRESSSRGARGQRNGHTCLRAASGYPLELKLDVVNCLPSLVGILRHAYLYDHIKNRRRQRLQ